MIRRRLRGTRVLAAGLLVAAAAIGCSLRAVGNSYAQDDVPLVVEDARAHDLGKIREIFTEAYWPAPYQRDLYRPLTSLLITLEWKAGHGASFSYKAVQLGIYGATAIAVLILALQLLPLGAATAAALLFAVHPVHVEAVALAVNQAEVIVGMILALAVAWYLAKREDGPIGWRGEVGLALTTLVAAHFKETGLMLAPLLVMAELLAVRQREAGWWPRLRRLGLWQALAGVIVIAIRAQIQGDRLSGTFTAETLEHASMWNRAETMLQVVPEWLRLLLWPASLQADYSPNVILPATGWGAAQWLGVAIILLVGVLAVRLFRRAPAFTYGIVWVAIGIFPVSNVLVPTGITMAERTLFLPSIGAMLAVAALGAYALTTMPAARATTWRRIFVAGTAGIALLGALRSFSRMDIWRNSMTMWRQTLIDAPDSYRARVAFGTLLYRHGWPDRGIESYRQALRLWDKTEGPIIQLAEWHRERAECELAIPLYRYALTLRDFAPARSSLVACLAWIGQYREARLQALEGMRSGYYGGIFHIWIRTMLDAERASPPPPPHTVRFPTGHKNLFDGNVPRVGGLKAGGMLEQ